MNKIFKLIYTLIFTSFIFLAIKLIILPLELKTHSKPLQENKKVWQGIDSTKIKGVKIDTCLYTQMNGKIYSVNVRQRTDFSYTPMKRREY